MDKPDIKLANLIPLHKQKFSGFWNPDSVTWGEKIHDVVLEEF